MVTTLLCDPVQSAESLGDEVEESSADVSPVLPERDSTRSVEDCGVDLISDGPQLVGHPPDDLLLHCLSSGGSVTRGSPGELLVLWQQVWKRPLPAGGLLGLLSERV